MRNSILLQISVCLILQIGAQPARAQVIQAIRPLPSTSLYVAYDLSSDGSQMAGRCSPPSGNNPIPTQWNGPGNPVALSLLPFDTEGVAFGISGDGSTAVGESVSGGTYHATRWTSSGVLDLGHLPFSTAAAYSASFDGSVIVGTSGNAFRWTANVMQDLGHLPGATSAVAYKVSADGGVVVGYSGNLPFRWSQSTGMQELPVISGTIGAEARAVSADGSLIAGNISTDATGRAALWTATGVQLLSPLVGSQRSVDYGISPDGRFLVGLSGGSGNFATIWDTATNQTFDLRSFLIANGIDLTGWSLLEVAYSISGDNILGYNIVGGGVGPTGPAAFLVTGLHVVPEPSSLAFVGCLAGGLVGCRRRRRR